MAPTGLRKSKVHILRGTTGETENDGRVFKVSTMTNPQFKPVHSLAAQNLVWRATDGEPFESPEDYWEMVHSIATLLADGRCVLLKRIQFGKTPALQIFSPKRKTK